MKRIVFVTGTRADYGKMKRLMKMLEKSSDFEMFIYITGMHLSSILGNTYTEVLKDRYKNAYVAYGQAESQSMSYSLGDAIRHMTGYVEKIDPDLIVIHGDRTDALAGAVVGALNNIIVAHIEGGELSGTIDGSIRHAISKFAHVHFVCNDEATSITQWNPKRAFFGNNRHKRSHSAKRFAQSSSCSKHRVPYSRKNPLFIIGRIRRSRYTA